MQKDCWKEPLDNKKTQGYINSYYRSWFFNHHLKSSTEMILKRKKKGWLDNVNYNNEYCRCELYDHSCSISLILGNIENIIAFLLPSSWKFSICDEFILLSHCKKKETRWRIFDCLCLCDKRETLNPKFRVEYLIILS